MVLKDAASPTYQAASDAKSKLGKKHDLRSFGLVMLNLFARNDEAEEW